MTAPVLSICIPSFNRRDMVHSLVESILTTTEPVEVCVHVDGSADGTFESLSAISDPRLVLTHDINHGNAYARRRAVEAASGDFILIFNDDDVLFVDSLPQIIRTLQSINDPMICGIVLHYENSSGHLLGTPFAQDRTNFLQMRLDERVLGDKREVIRASVLKPLTARLLVGDRRVPLSLIWYTAALDYDVLCVPITIGVANYLEGGISSQIARVKRESPRAMVRQKLVILRGFLRGRHRSLLAVLKALGSALFYSLFVLERRLFSVTETEARFRYHRMIVEGYWHGRFRSRTSYLKSLMGLSLLALTHRQRSGQ